MPKKKETKNNGKGNDWSRQERPKRDWALFFHAEAKDVMVGRGESAHCRAEQDKRFQGSNRDGKSWQIDSWNFFSSMPRECGHESSCVISPRDAFEKELDHSAPCRGPHEV